MQALVGQNSLPNFFFLACFVPLAFCYLYCTLCHLTQRDILGTDKILWASELANFVLISYNTFFYFGLSSSPFSLRSALSRQFATVCIVLHCIFLCQSSGTLNSMQKFRCVDSNVIHCKTCSWCVTMPWTNFAYCVLWVHSVLNRTWFFWQ